MNKKIILVIVGLIILLIAGIIIYKKVYSKPNEIDVEIAANFDQNFVRLVNRDYKDNWLISPYSMKVALSMLSEGAKGNTKAEIENLLKHNEASKINNSNIKIANALFIHNSVKDFVEESFTSTIKNNYNGEVLYDEFKSPAVINDWVKLHTDQMIPKVIDSIPPNFIAGLANAIAIDVNWTHPFECPLTNKESFTQKDGKKIDIEMMHNEYETSDVKYFDDNKVTGIIIPYKEDTNLEFIGLLPKDNIDSYLFNLDLTKLDNLTQNATEASGKLHINLSLPRFKYDFDLGNFLDMLVELGMKDAFDDEKADFTGIITRENLIKHQRGNIYVEKAVHKAAIDLNEKGTKAAAVTYFGLKDAAALMPNDFKTINIEFNKTFAYVIREKTTKDILFFGVVNSPNKWNGSTCKEA